MEIIIITTNIPMIISMKKVQKMIVFLKVKEEIHFIRASSKEDINLNKLLQKKNGIYYHKMSLLKQFRLRIFSMIKIIMKNN